MEQGARSIARRRRRFFPAFMVTMFWLVPALLATAGTGFFLARDVFSPRFLRPSAVQSDRPKPIRVLSPEEASRVARDEDSTVWRHGIRSGDVPELPSASRKGERRRTTTQRREHPATKQPTPVVIDTPDSNDAADTGEGTGNAGETGNVGSSDPVEIAPDTTNTP